MEGFTADHLDAFKKHGTERVLIAYDRDEAGDRAADRLAEMLTAEGIECFRVVFPRGMDANEYARKKMTPATKALELVVRQPLGGRIPRALVRGNAREPRVLDAGLLTEERDLLLEAVDARAEPHARARCRRTRTSCA